MSIKQKLGIKIKRMRQNRGLTQEALAEAVEISQRTMSGIEIGENFVTADTLDKIINALETTPEELFAIDHLKPANQLIEEIKKNIQTMEADKLEIVYKVVKSLSRE